MREALDRLQEAMTALDNQLNDAYYLKYTPDRMRLLDLLFKAKRSVWFAQMHVLNAAAGSPDCAPL